MGFMMPDTAAEIWQHFSKWILGVAGAGLLFVAESARRRAFNRVSTVNEKLEDLAERVSTAEAGIQVLEEHCANGTRERAEIKTLIGKVDGKIDTLTMHLLKKD